MIFENEDNATEELKRVDHLIYVTLKYTRTVDVMRNIIKRLINTMDYQIEDLLKYEKNLGKVKEIPAITLVRCKMLEKLYPKDDVIKDLIDFYVKLRRILASEYKAREEYRKNVTLITEKENVDVEKLKLYAEKTKTFINYLKSLMK